MKTNGKYYQIRDTRSKRTLYRDIEGVRIRELEFRGVTEGNY